MHKVLHLKNIKPMVIGVFTLMTAILFLAAKPVYANPTDPYAYTWTELAPGVWSGVRENSPIFPVMGTSTFVVGDEGVVVFDGGGAPLMTERLMAKVAGVTDKPITHVVISHWHGDHNFGIWRIVEEFPDVAVISHPFTRAATIGRPMDYVKNSGTAMERLLPYFEERLSTGIDDDGTVLSEKDLERFRYIIDHKDLLDSEFKRYAATLPTVTFEDKMVIYSGSREIHLLHLGDANTEGDIIMWLPEEKIVATGDAVVFPTPYAFNTDPKKWGSTMEAVNDLGYKILVPGHGDIQYDMNYVNLIIEALDSVATQTDQFIADGLSQEEAGERLDFSAFDERFTGGDAYTTRYYKAWFTDALRSSAYRAAMGEVMVKLEREEEVQEASNESEED